MKTILTLIILLFSHATVAQKVNLLVVGDSQVGATWGKTYFGNFLQECLGPNFIIFGKGASVPGHWLNGGLEKIEIIQRDPEHKHLNIGAGEIVPLFKKRLDPMIDHFQPNKILLSFGGNYTANTDEKIINEIEAVMKLFSEKGISSADCYFFTPTYEMEVATRRNVELRDLKNVLRITAAIETAINDRCQIIKGVDLMKSSPYFNESTKLIKREPLAQSTDCSGPASNDNVHVCGKAAQDMARKVCDLI